MMKCVAARFFFSHRAHTISQGWFSHFIKASVFVNGKRLMKKKEDENERRWDNFFLLSSLFGKSVLSEKIEAIAK